MLTDIRYSPNLLQKSPIIRTFNRDGSDFITIFLKFAGLYDVIAIDLYLFIYRYLSNIPKKLALCIFPWHWKEEYRTNQTIPAYVIPQDFASSNINIQRIKWFRLDILSFAVKSFIVHTFKGPAVSTIELTTKKLKESLSVCFLETSLQ